MQEAYFFNSQKNIMQESWISDKNIPVFKPSLQSQVMPAPDVRQQYKSVEFRQVELGDQLVVLNRNGATQW